MSLNPVQIGVRMGVGLYSRNDSSGLLNFRKKHQDKIGFISILQIIESPPI